MADRTVGNARFALSAWKPSAVRAAALMIAVTAPCFVTVGAEASLGTVAGPAFESRLALPSRPHADHGCEVARSSDKGRGGFGRSKYDAGAGPKFDPYGKKNPYAVPEYHGRNDPYSIKNFRGRKGRGNSGKNGSSGQRGGGDRK